MMTKGQRVLGGLALAVGVCVLWWFALLEQQQLREAADLAPTSSAEAYQPDAVRRARDPLPTEVRFTAKTPLKSIEAFIAMREARLLLAWDGYEIFMRQVHAAEPFSVQLYHHGRVLEKADQLATEEIVAGLPEWVYLSDKDQEYLSRKLVIHDQILNEREKKAELFVQRLGWKDSEGWLKYGAPMAFRFGLEVKDYLGSISAQRQREFLDAVEAALREEQMEGFWEAIVGQDGAVIQEHLDKHADAGKNRVLSSDHAGLFAADFPSEQEDAGYLAAMMMAQALVLGPTERSYLILSQTGLLYMADPEHDAVQESLVALLAENVEAP